MFRFSPVLLLVALTLAGSAQAAPARHAVHHARVSHRAWSPPPPYCPFAYCALNVIDGSADPGVCDDHGGLAYMVSEQTDTYTITHYVACADGTAFEFVEEGILSGWSSDVGSDDPPADDNSGSPPSDYQAADDPCNTAPWGDGCSGGS